MTLSYEEAVAEAFAVQQNVDILNVQANLGARRLQAAYFIESAIDRLVEVMPVELRTATPAHAIEEAAAIMPEIDEPEQPDELLRILEEPRHNREIILRDMALTTPVDDEFMEDLRFAELLLGPLRLENQEAYSERLWPIMSKYVERLKERSEVKSD